MADAMTQVVENTAVTASRRKFFGLPPDRRKMRNTPRFARFFLPGSAVIAGTRATACLPSRD
jgi:hypothetical protein